MSAGGPAGGYGGYSGAMGSPGGAMGVQPGMSPTGFGGSGIANVPYHDPRMNYSAFGPAHPGMDDDDHP